VTPRRGRLATLAGFLLAAGCAVEPSAPAPRRAPERIVVMAPAAAEMLDALGVLDRVVGIGDFVREPRAVAELPRLGAYDAPNVERVLDLGADTLVTSASDAAAPAHERLASLGVRVLALDTSTFEGVFTSLQLLGRELDREQEARFVQQRIQEQLDAIAARAASLPRRTVLFVVGRDPLHVAGPGSHIDRMIALAGGTNVASGPLPPYPRLSLEAIIEARPEVIVDASDNDRTLARGRRRGAWSRFPTLPAVTDDRVWSVEPDRLVIPGIRLPEMTLLMARLVHPEVFGEPEASDLASR
jgi:iron complex transport system substrate-binding protein